MPEIAFLLGVLAILLVLGIPVAFAVGLATTSAMLAILPAEPALVTIVQRVATSLDSFSLLAIPFFVLAGELMNHGGSAGRLVDLASAVLGRMPGALAHVHVVASMLFGAISGSAVATASAMGALLGPRMRAEGYGREFSAAINISAATTGLIIPPSNILIVYSLASGGVSIAALFVAGYVPGILLGLSLMVVAALLAPPGAGRANRGGIGRPLAAALPSLGLPVVVMGGILSGVFTATEASAVAVAYALVLALAQGALRPSAVPAVFVGAARTTGVVLFLVATSVALSWVLAYGQAPQAVSGRLLALTSDPTAILLIVNLTLLAAGTFLDMTPAVLIFTPIFLPVVRELGMDPVQFGIMLVLNLCIGLCTPPVGTVLFVGLGVAETRLESVLRPLLPLFAAMLVTLLAVNYLLGLSLWLPGWLGFLG